MSARVLFFSTAIVVGGAVGAMLLPSDYRPVVFIVGGIAVGFLASLR